MPPLSVTRIRAPCRKPRSPNTPSYQELSRKACDGLFGGKAVAGHSFLLAKARDINAASAKQTDSRTDGLLDAIPKPPSHGSSPASHDNRKAPIRGERGANMCPDGNGREGAKGRLRHHAEELGKGGEVLKRLKPLLDGFIQEDTHRTGTLPVADFRRVLCEGHGGLWPDLAAPSERRVTTRPGCTDGKKSEAGTER